MIRERMGAGLSRLAQAYRKCVLLFEGSRAFEVAIMSCVEAVILLGRQTDLDITILTSSGPADTEVMIAV
jgi:hypothetical protein